MSRDFLAEFMEFSHNRHLLLQLLLQGFQPFLCNPHNHHLRTFYLITPALIMNYIDYRVKQKLKIHKKDLAKISLFEDGCCPPTIRN